MTSVAACAPCASIARAARSFSRTICAIAGASAASSIRSRLRAVVRTPGAERLRQHEHVAGTCAGVRHDALRVYRSGDGEAVLRLVVFHGVAAEDRHAGLGGDRRAAFDDPREDLGAELFDREGGDVQRGQRRPAHRVDVAQRVRRGDAAEVVRIVDDGREEVDGLDECEIVAEAVDAGIVAGRDDRRARSDPRGTASGAGPAPGRRRRLYSLNPRRPNMPSAVSGGRGTPSPRNTTPCLERPPEKPCRRAFCSSPGPSPSPSRSSLPAPGR